MQTKTLNKNIDVLIVGAGPTGLMMACQLAIRGIHFRIIDKNEHPVTYSGAFKQKIIGSVFPEKLYFRDNEYRTTKLNEAVEILCKTDKGLGQKKGGKKTELSVSSLRVGSNLPCSNQITNENLEELKEAQMQQFLADLRAISHFCKAFRVGQNKGRYRILR